MIIKERVCEAEFSEMLNYIGERVGRLFFDGRSTAAQRYSGTVGFQRRNNIVIQETHCLTGVIPR